MEAIDGSAFKILHLQTGLDDYAANETVLAIVRNEDADQYATLIFNTAIDNVLLQAILEQVSDTTATTSTPAPLGFSSKESIIGGSDNLQIKTNTTIPQNETLTMDMLLLVFGEIPTKTVITANTSKTDDFEYTY